MSASGLGVHEFEVVSNEPAADGLMRIVLSAPELASAIKPGQFVNVSVPGDASQILRVPLSFSCADAAAGTVEIVYAVVGDGTRRLAAMAAGETSTAVGPCGNPLAPRRRCPPRLRRGRRRGHHPHRRVRPHAGGRGRGLRRRRGRADRRQALGHGRASRASAPAPCP